MIDRLTRRVGTDAYMLCGDDCWKNTDCNLCPAHDVLLHRLAAYEDTGLTPEELDDFARQASAIRMAVGCKTFEDCYELASEGRLIVLPCKVGDTFYTLEKYCSDGQDDGIKTRHWGSDCDDFCCTYPCDAEIRVTEWKWASPIRILQEQKRIGKTVFLTREEAEAALGRTDDE